MINKFFVEFINRKKVSKNASNNSYFYVLKLFFSIIC